MDVLVSVNIFSTCYSVFRQHCQSSKTWHSFAGRGMPRLKATLGAREELQVENEHLLAKMEKLQAQTSQQQARIAKLEAEVAHLRGQAPARGAKRHIPNFTKLDKTKHVLL